MRSVLFKPFADVGGVVVGADASIAEPPSISASNVISQPVRVFKPILLFPHVSVFFLDWSGVLIGLLYFLFTIVAGGFYKLALPALGATGNLAAITVTAFAMWSMTHVVLLGSSLCQLCAVAVLHGTALMLMASVSQASVAGLFAAILIPALSVAVAVENLPTLQAEGDGMAVATMVVSVGMALVVGVALVCGACCTTTIRTAATGGRIVS